MNCPNCRHANAGDARFCSECGTALPAAPPPPAGAAAAPPRKSAGNKVVLIVLGVFLGLVLLAAVGIYAAFHLVASKVRAIAGTGQTSSQAAGAASTDSETRQGATVAGNVIGGLLGTDAKGKADIGQALDNVARAGQQIGQHQATGGAEPNAADTQQALTAAGGLLGAMGRSLGGAQRHAPVDFRTLVSLLPTRVPGLQRGTPAGAGDAAMGVKTTEATVDFRGPDGAQVRVLIKDVAAFSGVAGFAQLANQHESQQGNDYERNETLGGYRVHAVWEDASKSGRLSVLVGKRFAVDVNGYGVDMDLLRATLAQIDLGKLESMQDANPVAE